MGKYTVRSKFVVEYQVIKQINKFNHLGFYTSYLAGVNTSVNHRTANV
jgi:hypothetical protein